MIVVVDYGVGNLGSILNMLKKIGAEAITSTDVSQIDKADKIILPGVGSFDTGVKKLRELQLMDVLNKKALIDKIPVLGICLGMQLFSKQSQEGNLPGLGWFDAETVKFSFKNGLTPLKVPHMGWNYALPCKKSKLLNDMNDEIRFYFVHSYHIKSNNQQDILATTKYGYEFVSSLEKDNILGVQFHPEKSHKFGMRLLKNFVELF